MNRKIRIEFHKDFEKQLAKLPTKKRTKTVDAIEEYARNPKARSLRDHTLTGMWAGHRSISAGGDLRLHFRIIIEDADYIIFFVAVGTHSQLYK